MHSQAISLDTHLLVQLALFQDGCLALGIKGSSISFRLGNPCFQSFIIFTEGLDPVQQRDDITYSHVFSNNILGLGGRGGGGTGTRRVVNLPITLKEQFASSYSGANFVCNNCTQKLVQSSQFFCTYSWLMTTSCCLANYMSGNNRHQTSEASQFDH